MIRVVSAPVIKLSGISLLILYIYIYTYNEISINGLTSIGPLQLWLTFQSSWRTLPGDSIPLCISLARSLVVSTADVCSTALFPFTWKFLPFIVFCDCCTLLHQLSLWFITAVCVGTFLHCFGKEARHLGTMRTLVVVWGIGFSRLAWVTGLQLSILSCVLWVPCLLPSGKLLWSCLSWEEAGVENVVVEEFGCWPLSEPQWELGGKVEVLAFVFRYSSAKSVCLWRATSSFLWCEAREMTWYFNTPCWNESDITLGQESNNIAVIWISGVLEKKTAPEQGCLSETGTSALRL